MSSKERLNFYCTGTSFTRMLYDMWSSGEVNAVLTVLEQDGGLPKSVITKFLQGKLRFEGDTRERNHELYLVENVRDNNYVNPPVLSIHSTVRVLERQYVKLQLNIQRYINERYLSNELAFNSKDNLDDLLNNDERLTSMTDSQKRVMKNLSSFYSFVGQDPFNFPLSRFLPVLSENDLEQISNFQLIKRRIKDSSRARLVEFNLLKDVLDTGISIDSNNRPEFTYKECNSITGPDGWISRSGKFIPCGYGQHSAIAKTIVKKFNFVSNNKDNYEWAVENNGWIKISNGKFYTGNSGDLSQSQIDIIFDYMSHNSLKSIFVDYIPVSLSDLPKLGNNL